MLTASLCAWAIVSAVVGARLGAFVAHSDRVLDVSSSDHRAIL